MGEERADLLCYNYKIKDEDLDKMSPEEKDWHLRRILALAKKVPQVILIGNINIQYNND